jgi:hypothetical protein
VLSDPEATLPAIEAGAAYLVTAGSRDAAGRAVERARSAGVASAVVSALEAVRRDRFPDLSEESP